MLPTSGRSSSASRPTRRAGGIVLRDLFESDDGGWLQDPALLDRLVAEKLEREAEAVRAEGWKWIEVAPDFPYGHTYGLQALERHRGSAQRGGDGGARRAQGRIRAPRGAVCRRRRAARGGRQAARRDRDGPGGVRSAARPLRCRRGCAVPAPSSASTAPACSGSSAAMCGPRTSRLSPRKTSKPVATPRPTAPRSRAPRRLPAMTLAPEEMPASTSRMRTRASARCRIGS